MVKEKYKKLGYAAVSLLPGGQYYVAKKKGKTGDELKWFKRLEYGRAVFLADAAASAVIGDYPAVVGNLATYGAMSLPANMEKTDEYEYELEKSRLAEKKGPSGKIRGGWHELKTRFKDAVADPEVATYVSLAAAANSLAALGGENMLYKTWPHIDNLTHFAGGVGWSKFVDKLYERENLASYLKEKLESAADRIDEKKGKIRAAAKYALKKLSRHPKAVLGVATVSALGAGLETFEKAGDTLVTSAGEKAFFGESAYNKIKDMFVDVAGSLTYYYSKNKKRASETK